MLGHIEALLEGGRGTAFAAAADLDCPLRWAVAVPLTVENRVLGALVAYAPRESAVLARAAGEVARWVCVQLELAELDRSRTQLIEAEIKALRAQISPHFIFNSLAAIASFVRTDPEQARELLLEFADFTRYSFRRHGEFTTLADELHSIDQYLALVRARFGRRLSVTLQVAPEVLPVASAVSVDAQSVEVDLHQHRAVFGAQGADRLADVQGVDGRVRGVLDRRGALQQSVADLGGARLAGAPGVDGEAAADREQPGPHRVVGRGEGLRMLPGAYQGLLHQVLGPLPVPEGQAEQEVEEGGAVFPLQLRDGPLIGRRRGRHERPFPREAPGRPRCRLAYTNAFGGAGTGGTPRRATSGRSVRRMVRRTVKGPSGSDGTTSSARDAAMLLASAV
ncbi:hypothetical protein SMICM304S_05940 [Streptomyces microflavus]